MAMELPGGDESESNLSASKGFDESIGAATHLRARESWRSIRDATRKLANAWELQL